MSSPVTEVKPSEVVQLKRSRDALCGVIVELQEQIKHLKADNDELKTKLIKVPKGTMNYSYMKDMENEIKTLKEENDRLEQFHEWDKIATIKLCEARREITTLKEQIEKNMETNEYTLAKVLDDNKKLKEEIKKLKVSINSDDEDEDLQMVMFEGKEYYVDTYDDDVYDTSHEIVGSWDGEEIIFKEDTENIVKDVVNDIIDEVLDKSLP